MKTKEEYERIHRGEFDGSTTNADLLNAMKQNGNLIIAHVGNPEPKKPVLKSRRFAMVIGNELHLRKYEDPAHGWLAVPIQWLEALNIVGDVSDCSYLKGSTAYLEEDCDAPVFRQAAEKHGFRLFVDYRHTDERSPIRSYPSFTRVIEQQTELTNSIVSELIKEGE